MAYYLSNYSNQKRKKKKSNKIFIWFFVIVIITILGLGYSYYEIAYKPNVWTFNKKPEGVNIPQGTNFKGLKEILFSKGLIIHRKNFEIWAKFKKLPELIKPGHYVLNNGMNNYDLVKMFRTGNQTPVKVIFNSLNNVKSLAGVIGRQLEPDSSAIMRLLSDSAYIAKMGFNKYTLPAMFIPNTYQFYWTTTPEGFVKRMNIEYNKFWNPARKKLADSLGLNPVEVATVASIIEKESNKIDEWPVIASVYLNRLKRGWRLQADPTVIFALGDYHIHRVLNAQKKVKSPYNTYLHRGLPPGPICIPSITAIDAVLHAAKTHYLYFCAKADFSGYHAFSKTNAQHVLNALKYQKALNDRNIYR